MNWVYAGKNVNKIASSARFFNMPRLPITENQHYVGLYMKDFFSNMNKSAGNCEIVYIY